MKKLDRPIIVIGHARGGTTLLAGLINWHSHVGIKPDYMKECKGINEFIDKLLVENYHLIYGLMLEKKELWTKYLFKKKVHFDIGKEIIVEKVPSKKTIEIIRKELSENFKEKRLLQKSPALSFAVSILPKIFPEPKIIAIYRDPIQVINSFKHRAKRFNLEEIVNKYNETIYHIEKFRNKMDIYTLNYSDLIQNSTEELKKIFDYCELPLEKYIHSINLKPSKTKMILTETEMYKIMEKVYEN